MVGGQGISSCRFGQDSPAAFIIGTSEISQALTAGGAVYELRAEALLEKTHMFAHHRRGKLECFGRSSKGA